MKVQAGRAVFGNSNPLEVSRSERVPQLLRPAKQPPPCLRRSESGAERESDEPLPRKSIEPIHQSVEPQTLVHRSSFCVAALCTRGFELIRGIMEALFRAEHLKRLPKPLKGFIAVGQAGTKGA